MVQRVVLGQQKQTREQTNEFSKLIKALAEPKSESSHIDILLRKASFGAITEIWW